jgi:hypothetical protein
MGTVLYIDSDDQANAEMLLNMENISLIWTRGASVEIFIVGVKDPLVITRDSPELAKEFLRKIRYSC